MNSPANALRTMADPSSLEADRASTDLPWWRYPMVWLVIAGPAAVVVAGVVTATIAFRGADVALLEGAARSSTPVSTTPAVQARNHAATAR